MLPSDREIISMNRTHRPVLNPAPGLRQAVAGIARSMGKGARRSVIATALAAIVPTAWADNLLVGTGGAGGHAFGPDGGAGGINGGNGGRGYNLEGGGGGGITGATTTLPSPASIDTDETYDYVVIGGGGGGGASGNAGTPADYPDLNGTTGGAGELGVGSGATLTVNNDLRIGGFGGGAGGGGMEYGQGGSGGNGGAGTLTLDGASTVTVTGQTTIGGGGGSGGPASSSGIPGRGGAGTLNLGGGSTLNANGGLVIGGGSVLNIGHATADGATGGTLAGLASLTNGGAINFNQSDASYTFGIAIAGNGAVTQNGSGTTVLTGASTYSGGTTISAGTLQIGADDNLGDAAGALAIDGGALRTTASLAMDRATTLGAGGGTFSVDAGTTLTHDGAIGGSGPLAKTGAGTLALTGANTYLGGTTISAGTLRIGADDNLGDATGALAIAGGATLQATADLATSRTTTLGTGNGTFDVDGGTTLTHRGAVSGTGTLAKAGAGTLRLTGASTHTGGTTVSNGTLAVDGGSISHGLNGLSVSPFAGDTGTLVVQAGGSVGNLNAIIANSGGSIGTATVTGAGSTWTSNSLTVGWFGNGALDIADGGQVTAAITALGWGAGGTGLLRLDDGGVLETASMAKGGGAATLFFSGGTLRANGDNNDFLGNFAAGDVTLEAGGGTFDSNGHDIAVAAPLSGPGGLAKTGEGTLTLSGTNSYAGGTTVSAGTLVVNGSSTGGGAATVSNGRFIVGENAAHGGASYAGNVTVGSGGTVGGHGTIAGDVAVSGGGAFAPGNSIGITTVAGHVSLANGSTTVIEIGSGGSTPGVHHDQIAAATATVANGAKIHVTPVSNADDGSTGYAAGTQYAIIATTGGLTVGGTQAVADDYAYLDFTGSFDARNYYLTTELTRQPPQTPDDPDAPEDPGPGRPIASFCLTGHSANQCAAGDGAFSLGAGKRVYDAVLNLSRAQADSALNQLSGEIHASARAAMIEDSRYARNAANDRLRAAFGAAGASRAPALAYVAGNGPVPVAADHSGLAFWSQAYGSWGSSNGDGNAARLSRSTGGLFVGADAPVSRSWRVGAFAGYGSTHVDVDGRRSSGSSDDYHLGVYGGAAWGRLALRTGAIYTWHDISASRSVAFAGFSDRLEAGYHAGTAQAFGELGYGIAAGGGVRIEPYANLAHVRQDTDGYAERGGAAALDGRKSDDDMTFATLGLRAEKRIELGKAQLTLTGTAGWRHAFGDTAPEASHRFAGGSAFTVAGVPIARNSAVVEAGVDFALSSTATLGVSYTGQLASGARDHGARANLSVRF